MVSVRASDYGGKMKGLEISNSRPVLGRESGGTLETTKVLVLLGDDLV